ncbi:MAG TPA: SURF1 family cytochrome oxidase biogenesis protein [Terrimesophilobacter sp.]|nr:SURF1 family cytochrome oxidase biogenesis protein [Terrimesophilobacter sp.]
MWKVALRPRWIAALIACLAVAAGFALLAQWQIERSVDTGIVLERPTETVMPLDTVTTPQGPTGLAADGQLVSVEGTYVDGDWLVVSNRHNGGEPGYWVVGHLVTPDRVGLVVAVGWTASEHEAGAIADRFNAFTPDVATVPIVGRYFASEGPQDSDYQAGELSTVAPSAFINLWRSADPGGVYGGYLVAQNAATGLEVIDSHPPPTTVEVNWLNIFYAIEWVIFAGFAVFIWWRLVRDEFEKEQHQAAPSAEPELEA